MMETMRKFFQSIPNKIKAIYLIWFLIHFILYLISGNGFTHYNSVFFPLKESYDGFFGYPSSYFDLSNYDYSEFLVYILSPIFIYAIIYLWRKK